jgi:hypothetical protein
MNLGVAKIRAIIPLFPAFTAESGRSQIPMGNPRASCPPASLGSSLFSTTASSPVSLLTLDDRAKKSL